MKSRTTRRAGDPAQAHEALDALVIGGGVSGICALYHLQQLGISVQLAERGSGLGGTWFWNRYPGARFDSDSYSYAYFFSDVLAEEWKWSEHFAGQPEIERYLNFVVDRFDMRKNVRLNAQVDAARFNTESNVWEVDFADGTSVATRFLVPATGMLSQPYIPAFAGLEDFKGTVVHTGLWPAGGIDLTGKRVALIGTGSSGVQVAPAIADAASSLTVFQRGGHWVTPLNNRAVTPEEQEEFRVRFRELHESRLKHLGGFLHMPETRATFEVTKEERLQKYEELYSSMGLRSLSSNFVDTLTDPAANGLFTEFVADKIRARVNDKDLGERLIPKDHGYGQYRPPKDNGYFEIYNRDNVRLVSLNDTPIERITERGIKTRDEECEFDVIVLATGFDPWLGALKKIDLRGTDGRSLLETWADGGPKTYLGIGVPGFPNLLFVAGLHSLGGNLPAYTEVHSEWVAGLVQYANEHSYAKIETLQEAAEEWTQHVYECFDQGPIVAAGAWYSGANVAGGPKIKTLVYFGGLPAWRERSTEIAASGYKGIAFS